MILGFPVPVMRGILTVDVVLNGWKWCDVVKSLEAAAEEREESLLSMKWQEISDLVVHFSLVSLTMMLVYCDNEHPYHQRPREHDAMHQVGCNRH